MFVFVCVCACTQLFVLGLLLDQVYVKKEIETGSNLRKSGTFSKLNKFHFQNKITQLTNVIMFVSVILL